MEHQKKTFFSFGRHLVTRPHIKLSLRRSVNAKMADVSDLMIGLHPGNSTSIVNRNVWFCYIGTGVKYKRRQYREYTHSEASSGRKTEG